MIEYLEVRGSNREIEGIVDIFKSIIWHSRWFGVGDFEIYAPSSEINIDLLQVGNFVTRIDNDEIGIIEKVVINTSIQDGSMITASGRFAKSILDRRLIYTLSGHSNKATVIRGKVETAVRSLVNNNAINCTFDTRRNIAMLELGALSDINIIIVDENGNAADKQVSYQNLLEYTNDLLTEYGLSAKVILNDDTEMLQYIVVSGTDRSTDNTAGIDPVIFSSDYDNLTQSEYSFDTLQNKNTALIGGEGEGIDRFYSLIAPSSTGLDRREIFVDGSSISKKYTDEQEQEHEYTDTQYDQMLKTQGSQTLAPLTDIEEFTGSIIVNTDTYTLNEDFALGDIVTVQENSINKYINVRITEITEVQDENGYTVDVVYQ